MAEKRAINSEHFPVVVNSKCKEIDKVYPLKQKEVSLIFDLVSKYREVHRVYVFGSSVTSKCHMGSDIDICIDMDVRDGLKVYEIENAIGNICNWNCDILVYSNLGNQLKDTIRREGVIVYEQSA